jgi:hypothetical protein
MFSKVRLWGWSAAVCALIAAGHAQASERVAGEVKFEKRGGKSVLCTNPGICPPARPYWVLVLEDGPDRYESARHFAEGRNRAPEWIELESQMIRPGTRLSLAAQVEKIGANRYRIAELRDVNIEMDLLDRARLSLLWICRDAPGFERPLQVSVWRGQNRSLDDYEVRVILGDDESSVTISNDVDAEVDRDTLVYRADADFERIKLALDQSREVFSNVPAELRIWPKQPGPVIPGKSGRASYSARLRCDQPVR